MTENNYEEYIKLLKKCKIVYMDTLVENINMNVVTTTTEASSKKEMNYLISKFFSNTGISCNAEFLTPDKLKPGQNEIRIFCFGVNPSDSYTYYKIRGYKDISLD